MQKLFLKGITIVNHIDSRILIFLLLSFSFLTFSLHPNEETKFGIAKFFADENWLPHSFSFNQNDPTKLLYNLITGNLLNFLTFEQLAFWGRLFSYIGFAIVLSKLFRFAELGNLLIAAIFYIFRNI